MYPHPASRALLLLSLLGAAATGAACDATGSTSGGQALIVDPCAAPDLGHTWNDLYTCYFGPSGKASCTAQGFCHGAAGQTGALTSGYVCGTSREACWSGMTRGMPGCDAGSGSPEAGTDAAADASSEAAAADSGAESGASAPVCTPPLAPIVPPGSGADPTATMLWRSLRGASGPGLHNMPYSASAGGVTFTQADLDRISAWIREGAQDN